MRRWLVVFLALLVAVGAIYLLLSATEPITPRAPDQTEIDPESRMLSSTRKAPNATSSLSRETTNAAP